MGAKVFRTIDEQISIARAKGGISPTDDIKLQRFDRKVA